MRPQVYWNYLQRPQDRMALVIKTAAASEGMVQSIAGVIRSIDPEQPIYDVRSLDAVVDRSLARRWLQTTMLSVFAGLALLLAAIGVYGVIAYGVTQRTREFGIRLALGAHRREIVSMVVRQGLSLALIGAALGLAGASAGAGLFAGSLFGVRPFDPASFAMRCSRWSPSSRSRVICQRVVRGVRIQARPYAQSDRPPGGQPNEATRYA